VEEKNYAWHLNDQGKELLEKTVPKDILDKYKAQYVNEWHKLQHVIKLTQGTFDKNYTWMRLSERRNMMHEKSLFPSFTEGKCKEILALFTNQGFFEEKKLPKGFMNSLSTQKKMPVVIYGSSLDKMFLKIMWVKKYLEKTLNIKPENIHYILLGGKRDLSTQEMESLKKYTIEGKEVIADEIDMLTHLNTMHFNNTAKVISEKTPKEKRATTMSTLVYMKKEHSADMFQENPLIFVSNQPFHARQELMAHIAFPKSEGYNVICIGPSLDIDNLPAQLKHFSDKKVQVSLMLDELARFFYTVFNQK
jgi:hypothetical protein